MGFADGLDGGERKRGVKDDSRAFGLSKRKASLFEKGRS